MKRFIETPIGNFILETQANNKFYVSSCINGIIIRGKLIQNASFHGGIVNDAADVLGWRDGNTQDFISLLPKTFEGEISEWTISGAIYTGGDTVTNSAKKKIYFSFIEAATKDYLENKEAYKAAFKNHDKEWTENQIENLEREILKKQNEIGEFQKQIEELKSSLSE